MTISFEKTAPLATLQMRRWDDAFGYLHHNSEKLLGATRAQRLLDVCGDRSAVQEEIREAVEHLYASGTPKAGAFALAWSMLTTNPRYPGSFRAVLPQLQHALDSADMDIGDETDLRDRIRIWWRGAEGEFKADKRSMFAIAFAVLADEIIKQAVELPAPPSLAEALTAKWFREPYAGPSMVVMPIAEASKLNNYNKPFEAILDRKLPLVLSRNLDEAKKRLSYEFPHASVALSMLFRDLREGEPVRLPPTLLVGPPGSGKSRVVRKFAAAIGIQNVQRYQADASSDGQFAGTSKGWSNTEASVPARAVLASNTANPLVFIDEIDKAASNHHGSLFTSLLGFLDVETARSYPDQSTGCEFNLSMVSYCCTANDASVLPDMLKDRFRIIRIPAPRLVDLPLLAASIMDDMARENAERVGDDPLAPDELLVIARAWEKAGFSMRKLQKIVAATLEARDQFAMRH
jgi:ATP-dependent Lon protease